MTNLESAKSVLEQLLTKLGCEFEISETELGEKHVLSVDSPDHKLLIGKGGENLRALEYLVNNLARINVDDYTYVTVDVANYKKDKDDRLRATAVDAAERALQQRKPVHLKPMNSYERRIVHTELAGRPEIYTKSEGEDPYRSIVVHARDQ